MIDAGSVAVDGAPATDPASRPGAGATLLVRFDPGRRYRPAHRAKRETQWYRLVMDDPAFLVVDKPAGVLTVPAGEPDGGSLVERLLLEEKPSGRTRALWVVHRIDKHVSGLVVFARSAAALENLRLQFAARSVVRQYVAICEGSPGAEAGELISYLRENPKSLKMMPSRAGAGDRAVLRYRVLERFKRATLVEVRLETGRRNQIRVQFAQVGCPLLGDVAYGTASPLLPRVALHAARLEFLHPEGGARVVCEAPIPPDLGRTFARLRSER
jgi:23S rRNA pseudouridine1911/1915/1917 synthase